MFNPMDLTDRTFLVTGASSGLGRAISILLDKLGARCVLVGRDQARLEETLSILESDHHLVKPFDLNQVENIPAWMKELAGKSGPLDGLVHSAGVHITKPLRFLKGDELDDLMRVNFSAGIQLAKGLRQRNVCKPPASLVFLSSVVGLVGQPGVTAYSASKGALIAASRSLALELAPEQIRVNCIAPGQVQTEMAKKQQASLTAEQFQAIEKMHPLGLGEPKDIANAVAFLLADTGRWITGTTLVVDGGYTAS